MSSARRWCTLLAGLAFLAWLLTGSTASARAAGDDQIDSFRVHYTVNSDGSVLVKETIVLRFGASSGRHGLERWFVTREPYDDAHDMVFEISDPVVTSPSGASTQLTVERAGGGGRLRSMRVRVGDPDRTIYEATASYELNYTVRGALRTSGSYDELYWDVTGTQFPRVVHALVEVQVPGGVQQVSCSAGPAGTSTPCPASVSEGVGKFTASDIPAGHPLTIAAQISPGLVTENGPILVENADIAEQRTAISTLVISSTAALAVPLLGWWYYRRHGYDRRFAGLPPGVLPPSGESGTEVRNARVEIPVAFAPPKLPLAEAGLLLDGQPHVRQTTATLVGLAVDGAIRLRGGEEPEARLVDARRARDKPSAVLLDELFDGGETVADLSAAGALAEGHDRVTGLAVDRAQSDHWFLRRNTTRTAGTTVIAVLAIGYIAYLTVGYSALFVLPLLASVLITGLVLIRKLRRGQRTGYGRALTDQVEGFRRYLATAEADQLRFEEGEDIFSRYLPWAILFDLTDRWARVCQDLVSAGRLTSAAPGWYYGSSWDFNAFAWQVSALNGTVSAATAAPDFSGGTGFGGGSAFSGGGGVSGGGGGGGGGGSW